MAEPNLTENPLLYFGNAENSRPTVIFIAGTLIDPRIFYGVKVPEGYQSVYLRWMEGEYSHSLTSVSQKLAAFIRTRRFSSYILAGFSSGGCIALLTALALPQEFAPSGILLSNTGTNTKGHGNQKSCEELEATWNRAAAEAFVLSGFSRPPRPEIFKRLLDYAAQFTPQVRVEPLKSQRQIDLTGHLQSIECPVVVAHGNADKIRTRAHACQLVAEIPQAELFLLDGGHDAMLEDPDGFQQAFDRLVWRINQSSKRDVV